ncbi:PLP-dependent aminotransferase family protein [Cellulophaga baltica]|uniref:PLP-dependent transferase n=1 Tax=Cellulophaga baltica TaxID=76594 RepID=UPI00040FAA7F|nr:PLP-dependent transferase [Cellulophaga baltica]AIY14058.1 cystathionine beta-synthase [Cellulophaga baltica NN016038]
MKDMKVVTFIKAVLEQMPKAWLTTTTHRLDIYDEKLAKTEFLIQFEALFQANIASPSALDALPTAYDYIRLGHPLSCVLEWTIAKLHNLKSENVISFSSKTMPVLAILRKNLLANKKTRIVFLGALPSCFNEELIKKVYGYTFEFTNIKTVAEITAFEGSTILLAEQELGTTISHPNIDFTVSLHAELGSILVVHDKKNEAYISDIQHVRRRETIAMTPSNSLKALKVLVAKAPLENSTSIVAKNKAEVLQLIASVTGTTSKALVASSGLSIQYAIMMGLVDDAQDKHPGKPIKFIVPPNCYGGTNDQARRVAACLDNVEVVDLPVDGGHDMIHSIDTILDDLAKKDAVPYIIAEIPTNPRVEVPDLQQLKAVLTKERKTATGGIAIDPVFILDQTFCPNVLFLGEGKILSSVRTISYVSGSKFPSGGQCTAGYCVANTKSDVLLKKIETHLMLCDNEATPLQYKLLAIQLPSMNQRISAAYKNTREFVNFIQTTLPAAKINFVSESLAAQGFTPSVFSLDLPTKGTTDKEKEDYKRTLNLKLINLMITEIPDESKFCVSYGQLKGCYWTVPATSTQGTTKEGDKDYIVRASLSPDLDLQRHKEVFLKFVKSI